MFKNKEGEVRSGWKIVGVMGMFFAVDFIVSTIIGIGVVIAAMATGNYDINSNTFLNKELMEKVIIVQRYIQEIIMIIVPIFMWKVILKKNIKGLGLDSIKRHWKEMGSGLLLGIISFSIVFGVIILTDAAKIVSTGDTFHVEQLTYLLLFILVGFGEEILGRGYIMGVLRQTKNMAAVIIISGVIFALLHSSNNGVGLIAYINLFLVGGLLAYMFIESGNIWMPIGFHIMWNYVQGNIYGFLVSGIKTKGIITTQVQGNELINGGDFGPEGGVVVTGVIMLSLLFVKWYYRKSDYKFLEEKGCLVEDIIEQKME